MKHRRAASIVVIAALLAAGVASAASTAARSRASLIKVSMGTEPWIGYAPWWIAQKKGYFKAHGLDVRIVNFQTDGDRDSSLIAGKTDVSNLPTNGIIRYVAQGKASLKALLLEDASLGADAVLAKKGIASAKQLVGKKVAFEEGTTSDLLIHYLLRQSHIPFNAIKVVNAPAANAGTLLIAGKVDVAVTYEPYISNATHGAGGSRGVHVLYSSKDAPGLISDFLTTRASWLSSHGDVAKRLAAAWTDAMSYFRTNRADAIKIMAAGVGSKPADLTSTLAGVKLYTVSDNLKLGGSGALAKQVAGIGATMKAQGTIPRSPAYASFVDLSALK
jgi:NitT/TauT family transport system substrate-binding protein